MVKRYRQFTDQMRWAVREAPVTRYAISKQTGIDEGNLSRFVAGKSGLSLVALDKLAKLLGWKLVVREQRHQHRKAR
jgi:hypothetical protein